MTPTTADFLLISIDSFWCFWSFWFGEISNFQINVAQPNLVANLPDLNQLNGTRWNQTDWKHRESEHSFSDDPTRPQGEKHPGYATVTSRPPPFATLCFLSCPKPILGE